MAVRATWLLIAALTLGGAGLASAAGGDDAAVHAAKLKCGGFRQKVKTLQDRRARLVRPTPVDTTVRKLVHKRKPRRTKAGTKRRKGVERTVYRVHARLVGARREGDHDIHLVIAGTARPRVTMIVEFPDGRCARHAPQAARIAMGGARFNFVQACGPIRRKKFTKLHGTADITGVGFFDFEHGQRGVARNGIELHPVLSFQASGCRL